jgi:phosphoglucomutase
MLIFEFGDHTRIAIRASGTEPKIKYYLFAQRRPGSGAKFTRAELEAIKQEVSGHLTKVWDWLREDASVRAAA